MRGSLFGVNDGRPFTGSCADIQLPGGHLKGVRGLSLVQTAVLKGDRSHVIHYCCAFRMSLRMDFTKLYLRAHKTQ